MLVSELVKKLFAVMSEHGDLEVVGDVEVVNRKELHLRQVGVTQEESSIIDGSLLDHLSFGDNDGR